MDLIHALTRRKKIEAIMNEQSHLGKVLTTYDLIALGVGATLGVGVYVLPGVVSKEIAGPGVVLSFFYAAIVSALAGLCYAEFGARVPKAGSAYVYSYVTVGEFIAFLIGWNLIIEYIIGGASVAKGVSVYLDSLFDNAMADFFRSIYSLDLPFFSSYIDFFAFALSVIVCVGLAVGLKESLILNNLLTTVNCAVVVMVLVIGCLYADFKNWHIPNYKIPTGYGNGGFLPYGFLGTLRGAATCFYGFVGFDIIATSGEEVRNPRTAIPVSIIVSLFIIFIAYSGVSSVLTLMWPYFLQDVDAPIPFVFAELDLTWAKWAVTIGGLFGLGASLFGGMFPLPRVVYAMSQDGLLFECLGSVHPKYKTPFFGTVLSGIITGIMAAVFSLKDLVDLMSMATLVCYTIVAMSVLILRYRQEEYLNDRLAADLESSSLLGSVLKVKEKKFQHNQEKCARMPFLIYVLTTLCAILAFSAVKVQNGTDINVWFWWGFTMMIVFFSIVCVMLFFPILPSDTPSNTFEVPWIPVIPTVSIFLNLYLMFLMDIGTWIRFLLWLIAGLVVYFGYGLNHSKENHNHTEDYEELQGNK